jgi:uncharacterized protein
MIRRYLISSVLSVSLLTGCSTITPSRYAADLSQAEVLVQSGQNKEAAQLYKRLADVKSEEQNRYRLLTADAFLRANDSKQAMQYLALIDASALNYGQNQHFELLKAQIDLNQGNAETALTKLLSLQAEALNAPTKIAYYQSLAFAYSLTGDALQSAQTLINSDALLQSPKQHTKQYEQILTALSLLSEQDLHLKQPLSNPVLSGWMALARVFKLDPHNLSDNLDKWRKNYATHPANSVFLTEYVKNVPQNKESSSAMIAVMLPESGAYAAPAAVIKKGFIKAYKLAKRNGTANSTVHFYDTTSDSIEHLYQQAIKAGAKLIVGPLDKKDIKDLVMNTALTVPVLALNHVEGLSFPQLYQFALSPIDDAIQVTQKARQEGHQNALFVVPKSELGKRFSGYLTDNWKKLGGNPVVTKTYDDTKTDYYQDVKEIAQHVTEENAIDSIILNAYPKQARIMYPQMQRNNTTSPLAVYATSQIYVGDKRFEGVTFCDIPWIFDQISTGNLSKDELRSTLKELPPSYLRLLPMGIDAYQLTEHLTVLKTEAFNGATGKLKLDADNRITRELQCARFVNGEPQLLNMPVKKLSSESSVQD